MPYIAPFIVLTCLLFTLPSHADYRFINIKKGQFVIIDENDQRLVTINTLGFKKGWQWMGVSEAEKTDATDEQSLANYQYDYLLDKGNIRWMMDVETKAGTVIFDHHLSSKRSIPLTYIAFAVEPEKVLEGGYLIATDVHNKRHRLPFPLKPTRNSDIVELEYFNSDHHSVLTIQFPNTINIHHHGASRINLTGDVIEPTSPQQHRLVFSAKHAIQFYQRNTDVPLQTSHEHWFPFTPKDNVAQGEIGMADWLAPITSPLVSRGDKIFAGQKEYKAWGTNVEYFQNAPKKKDAEKRTALFAKYGINDVRLHKLSNHGWEGIGSDKKSSEYDPEKLQRFDYWLSLLKQPGIRYGFSPIWDLRVYEGDRSSVMDYDEIVSANPKKPVTTGLVWFAEDIQQLHIDTIINLLNHKNQYTQQRYAEDPALSYIEIQNEENAFFYKFMGDVKKFPRYQRLLAQQFSEWLTKKYRDHSGLVSAWGGSAIDTFSNEGGFPNENLADKNILPITNPWLHDNHSTRGYRSKRLQDTAEFLFLKQQHYYKKIKRAIRDTGFKGLIVAGNWQAGNTGAHFLNLLNDAETGVVDRHNYQGGAKGSPNHHMKSGFTLAENDMLHRPGSGLLSTGMQQVSGRPFMFSEWLSVLPSEWAAADNTIIAAYGFGLQGWDMSYQFASNGVAFSDTLNPADYKFNNLTPVGLGLFPVLSRMVLRQDIKEAEPIAIRRLSQQQAITNRYDFTHSTEHKGDNKSFSGTPSHYALAAGKILVEFTQQDGTSTIIPWKKDYLRTQSDGKKVITSSTKQLKWSYYDDKSQGLVEINSAGTQGIAGFSEQKKYLFNDISIEPKSPYSVILATAKSPNNTLLSDNQAIIVAIARAHNTGMNMIGDLLVNAGEAPVILEPVKANINLQRDAVIHILDHDGIKTGKTLPLKENKFFIDTARDKTIYYLIEFLEKE
ncbi:hypothetical protein ACVBE9_11520 [Eionea flava]